MKDIQDSICALSTASGKAALAVIRVSGPQSGEIALQLFGKRLELRTPQLCVLRNRESEIVDEVVACFFKAPNSFTGEDMLEISCHGNPIIVEQILSEIVSRETRPAEPGEFTRRALASGKMSIDQVEALDLVLNAGTELAAKRAIRSKLQGIGVGGSQLATEIMNLLVSVESQLDFSELETGALEIERLKEALNQTLKQLKAWVKDFDAHERLMRSEVIVLLGPPNSGKSSLFNALIGEEKAIVYDQPGTTRDFNEHELKLNGRIFLLIDTAGLRPNPDPIEKMGIERSLLAAKRADRVIWVDPESDYEPNSGFEIGLEPEFWLQSKCDLKKLSSAGMSVSVNTGEGLDDLRKALFGAAKEIHEIPSFPSLSSKRQRALVLEAAKELELSIEEIARGSGLDILAHHLQSAKSKLEALTGKIGSEQVLNEIFARFCIGK